MEAALGVEPRMRVLQTLALPFGDAAQLPFILKKVGNKKMPTLQRAGNDKHLEREMGLEPTTSTLAR